MKTLSFAAMTLSLMLAGFGAAAQNKRNEPSPSTLDSNFAAKYAIYAMLASNSYHKPPNERVQFPVNLLGWELVDEKGQTTSNPTKIHKFSGLAWDVYEKNGSSEVVSAFRGTDNWRDYLNGSFVPWPLAIQYSQSRKDFDKYVIAHPDKQITVVGHSLGGGLAAGISVRRGVDAVVFDPSPRIFDGLGDKNQPAKVRVVVYQDGEILEKVRKYWPKLRKTFPEGSFYKATFDFGAYNAHRSDQLALGLLKLGAKKNSELEKVLAATNNMLPNSEDLKANTLVDGAAPTAEKTAPFR